MAYAEVYKQLNWTKIKMIAKIAYDNTYTTDIDMIYVTRVEQTNINFNVALTLNVQSSRAKYLTTKSDVQNLCLYA